jgi:hypothetical protein
MRRISICMRFAARGLVMVVEEEEKEEEKA